MIKLDLRDATLVGFSMGGGEVARLSWNIVSGASVKADWWWRTLLTA
jgi:hypothetical protein